jgi:hypothetical protein
MKLGRRELLPSRRPGETLLNPARDLGESQMPIISRPASEINPASSYDAAMEKLARLESAEAEVRAEGDPAACCGDEPGPPCVACQSDRAATPEELDVAALAAFLRWREPEDDCDPPGSDEVREWGREYELRKWEERIAAGDDGISYEGCYDGVAAWDGYDDQRWEEMPEGLGMVDLVDMQVRSYREWRTDLGDLIAERLEGLAGEMRALEARSPGQYLDRRDAMMDSRA